MPASVDGLARCLVLGTLLDDVTTRFGGYELVAHWTQGEFHHDVVLRLPELAAEELPGRVLVVATNCNGGVKEVLCFRDVPDRRALWHHRCPGIDAFDGDLAPVLARATTEHWFDPCELLAIDPGASSDPSTADARTVAGGSTQSRAGARAPRDERNREIASPIRRAAQRLPRYRHPSRTGGDPMRASLRIHSPVVLALFIGWSLLTRARERLESPWASRAEKAAPPGPEPLPSRAPVGDPRLWN